jgi:hypothetical protein
MTGLLQHGVWRGGADVLLVRLKLIEVMLEAFVVTEVNFKLLKLFCSNLKMMFSFEAELVAVDVCWKPFHIAGQCRGPTGDTLTAHGAHAVLMFV